MYICKGQLTIFNPQGLLESKPGIKSQCYENSHDWNTQSLCDNIDSMQDICWVLDSHDGLEGEDLPLQSKVAGAREDKGLHILKMRMDRKDDL